MAIQIAVPFIKRTIKFSFAICDTLVMKIRAESREKGSSEAAGGRLEGSVCGRMKLCNLGRTAAGVRH